MLCSIQRSLPILLALFLVTVRFAGAVSKYENPITYGGITNIPCFLLAVVDLIFLVGMPIIVLFIIYSGFLFLSAHGNESQIAKARSATMWCIIGAVILLASKAIAMAIQATVLSVGGQGAAGFAC